MAGILLCSQWLPGDDEGRRRLAARHAVVAVGVLHGADRWHVDIDVEQCTCRDRRARPSPRLMLDVTARESFRRSFGRGAQSLALTFVAGPVLALVCNRAVGNAGGASAEKQCIEHAKRIAADTVEPRNAGSTPEAPRTPPVARVTAQCTVHLALFAFLFPSPPLPCTLISSSKSSSIYSQPIRLSAVLWKKTKISLYRLPLRFSSHRRGHGGGDAGRGCRPGGSPCAIRR